MLVFSVSGVASLGEGVREKFIVGSTDFSEVDSGFLKRFKQGGLSSVVAVEANRSGGFFVFLSDGTVLGIN